MIKMKKKPVKPVRGTMKAKLDFWDYDNLQEVMNAFKEHYDLTPGLKEVALEDDSDYDCSRLTFVVEFPEAQDSFDKRKTRYRKRLKEWEAWYKENSTEIEAIIAEKKAKIEKDAAEKITKEIARLKTRLARLESDGGASLSRSTLKKRLAKLNEAFPFSKVTK